MGVEIFDPSAVNAAYSRQKSNHGGFTFEVFKDLLRDLSLQFKQHRGRYFVLLSIEEAEHMRAIIHGRAGQSLLRKEKGTVANAMTTAGMWMMGDTDVTLLASSKHYRGAPKPQHNSMVCSYRFLNSDVYFDDSSIMILLRVLAENSLENRQQWWFDVRACRRRRQIALTAAMPVAAVFNTTDEFVYLEHKAVVFRIQHELQERGMLVFDAFRAFNSSHTGLMTCSELYGGIDFLGIPFSPEQVYALVRRLAVDHEVTIVIIIHSHDLTCCLVCIAGPCVLHRLPTRVPAVGGGSRVEGTWGRRRRRHCRGHSAQNDPRVGQFDKGGPHLLHVMAGLTWTLAVVVGSARGRNNGVDHCNVTEYQSEGACGSLHSRPRQLFLSMSKLVCTSAQSLMYR